MRYHSFLPAAIALGSAAGAYGQAATTTTNPLNAFISGAASAVGVLSSAAAQESATVTSSPKLTSASATASSSASSSASSTAAATVGGLNSRDILIIVIVSVVAGLLLLALLGGLIYCCAARRRRRRRAATTLPEGEVDGWRKPTNPGRAYTPVDGNGRTPDMAQQPTIPLMTPANIVPTVYDHPAYGHENPFVPVPPPHRKAAPNARAGLTDAAVPRADPSVGAKRQSGQRLRKSQFHSQTNSNSALSESFAQVDNGRTPLPVHHNGVSNGVRHGDRSPPYGMAAMTGAEIARADNDDGYGNGHRYHRPGSPYNSIGQPYEDTHVHRLVTDIPSNELQEVPLITPDAANHRYPTPPNIPSRSAHRHSPGLFRDSSYNSSPYGSYSDSPSGNGSGSGTDSWRTSQMNIAPEPPTAPWDERQRRWSGEKRQRSYSSSSRQSTSVPRVGPGGAPRRLRFSDFGHEDLGPQQNQGIGEAL